MLIDSSCAFRYIKPEEIQLKYKPEYRKWERKYGNDVDEARTVVTVEKKELQSSAK